MMDKIILYQMREINTTQVAKFLDEYTNSLLQKNKKVIRPFSDLISEIEHENHKFIPIVELSKISGYSTLKNVNFDCGTMNPKGAYYVSNQKRLEDPIFDFCAYVFSEDLLSFYFVSAEGKKTFVENQVVLFQKLREWGFIE